MDKNYHDTHKLWAMLRLLIKLFFVIVSIGFSYLLFQDEIQAYINRPQLTKAELAELAKKRTIIRNQEKNENWDLIENGIHVKTGLKNDPNLKVVIGACTSCHSAKLITQNRATREGWKNMIVWMQETQGLPDLGHTEPIIIDYLAQHYAPQEVGRRRNLDIAAIEWYILNLDKQTD
jgi:hypothetical protein